MNLPPGYQLLRTLYTSPRTVVIQARRAATEPTVILKGFLPDPDPAAARQRAQQEYQLTQELQGECFVPALDKIYNEEMAWLVFAESGGETLQTLLKTHAFSLLERVGIARQLAQALAALHAQGLIHTALNPTHILFNPTTGRLQLIGLGRTTVSPVPAPGAPPRVALDEGAYLAPEQTGCTPQPIDTRSDLYALGVVLYELLSGTLPFPSTEPMELLHGHLARVPTPLHMVNPQLPWLLSMLVAKLLAKAPAARYQSAWGVQADLTECLVRLQACQAQGRPFSALEPFPLARQDSPQRLRFPDRLFGRAREQASLAQALAHARTGQRVLVWVSGSPGIGKTALVRALGRSLRPPDGYYIEGKFEQFQPQSPYHGIVAAFRDLIRHLLGEPEASLRYWQTRLQSTLGTSGGPVLAELIPELGHLLGPQPAAPALDPVETQNRLHWAFQNLLRAFCQPEHPLVIFLDDLQWADAASLTWLERVVADSTLGYLLLLGAYREQEVLPDHPLAQTLDRLAQGEPAPEHLAVGPLEVEPMAKLLSETLSCPLERARSLATLLVPKTAGNPFFLNTVLQTLYRDQRLVFDPQSGQWQWDDAAIQASTLAAGVVPLLLAQVQQLSPAVQETLGLAACLGNRFDSGLLAQLQAQSVPETVAQLQEAVACGLLETVAPVERLPEPEPPTSIERLWQGQVGLQRGSLLAAETRARPESPTPAFRFTHDQIQQAAYQQVPGAEKPRLHRCIGHLLLEQTPVEHLPEQIFAIVDHLNASLTLPRTQAEHDELAELNQLAGRRAKAAAAWTAADTYFKTGLNLLGPEAWQRRYALTLALHEEAAEAAYLNQDYDNLEDCISTVLRHARTLLDKVKIYEIRIQAHILNKELLKAIATGLEILALLGIHFPTKPNPWHLRLAFARTRLNLFRKCPEDLMSLSPMTDPDSLAIIRLLTLVGSPAFFALPELMPLLIFKAVDLSITQGNAPSSAFAYAGYGLILLSQQNIEGGYQFSQLAVKLQKQSNLQEYRTRILYVHALFGYWKMNLRERLKPLLEIHQLGLETGDLEYAGYAIDGYFISSFWGGVELLRVEKDLLKYQPLIAGTQSRLVLRFYRVCFQAVQNLLGKSGSPCYLTDKYNEQQMLLSYKKENDVYSFIHTLAVKLQLCYLLHDYDQAAKTAEQIEIYLDAKQIIFIAPYCLFYIPLTQLVIAAQSPESLRKSLLEKVAQHQKRMRLWASQGPANFLHKYYLVEAERCRLQGRTTQAMELYDQAITLARQNQYVQEEALANELAARFYLSQGKTRIAQAYLQEAHAGYGRWGTRAKVRQLEQQYPEWLPGTAVPPAATSASDVIPPPASSPAAVAPLDWLAVVKASQVLSGEIDLNRLIEQLMTLLLQAGGATQAVLILKENEQLQVRARLTAAGSALLHSQPPVEHLCRPVATAEHLATRVIYYVARTQEPVVLGEVRHAGVVAQDPYLHHAAPPSLLCLPLLRHGQVTGLVYLENDHLAQAFPPARLEVLQLLAAQAAISLDNARLYTALERSEAQFRALYEQAVEGLFQCTLAGHLLTVNPAFARLLGEETPTTAGNPQRARFQDCFADPAEAAVVLRQVQDTGQVSGFETAWRRQDGSVCWVALSLQRACTSAPAVPDARPPDRSTYHGVVIDITARRERAAVQAAHARAEAANQAKSTLLATVSHEIRTPLTGMLGLVELLRQSSLPAPQAEQVETLQYAGEAVLAIVNDLLDYAQVEAGQTVVDPGEFSVARLIDSLMVLFSPRATAKGVMLISQLGPTVPSSLRGDSRGLRQVLTNLLTNALKFTDQGEVTLTVEFLPTKALACTVSDTGIGIASEEHAKLFARFSQTAVARLRGDGGAGLGLWICRQLVEARGGRIGCRSAAGQGSEFWFTWPCQPGSAPARPVPAAIPEETVPPLRLLLVEDIELNQQVACGLLERDGHQVTVCRTGDEALAWLQPPDPDHRVDAVLLDIHLPGIDGPTVARAIRRLPDPVQAAVPIIAVTAAITAEDVEQYRAAGMQAVVAKPIDRQALRRALAGIGPLLPAPASRNAETVLDVALLQQHRTALGQDRLDTLLQHLRDSSQHELNNIQSAWQQQQLETLAEAAHRLAGMSANFGLPALSQGARGIEQAAEAHRGEVLATLIAELPSLYARSMAALVQRGALPSPPALLTSEAASG
ncbi:MAG: AAA family ATPase [Candidatus Competibacteraceae bacterium]